MRERIIDADSIKTDLEHIVDDIRQVQWDTNVVEERIEALEDALHEILETAEGDAPTPTDACEHIANLCDEVLS